MPPVRLSAAWTAADERMDAPASRNRPTLPIAATFSVLLPSPDR
jgi:hypothetical protein